MAQGRFSTASIDAQQSTRTYYSRLIKTHGSTPRGVDWACNLTQQLRFVQLLKVCDFGEPFSLNDIGCGYGALLDFLRTRHANASINYAGFDVSPAMVAAARKQWPQDGAAFSVGFGCDRIADYSVASGVFNVRLSVPTRRWRPFVRETLLRMRQHSRKGMAVNFLLPRAEAARQSRALYRPQTETWARYCAAELGAQVERIERYGLDEVTLLMRWPSA